MISRDVERLVRGFANQHLDPEYIRYYLQETYRLSDKDCDEVLAKFGLLKEGKEVLRSGRVKEKKEDKLRKQGFF